MEGTYDPVLQALDVCRNVPVDLGAPGREQPSILLKAIDGRFAQDSDGVRRFLQAQVLPVHDHGDHVVGVPSSLLDVIREEVLAINHALVVYRIATTADSR